MKVTQGCHAIGNVRYNVIGSRLVRAQQTQIPAAETIQKLSLFGLFENNGRESCAWRVHYQVPILFCTCALEYNLSARLRTHTLHNL